MLTGASGDIGTEVFDVRKEVQSSKIEKWRTFVLSFFQDVTGKATRASKFATGGGVGMIIMGSASVAVFARRFLTRGRAS